MKPSICSSAGTRTSGASKATKLSPKPQAFAMISNVCCRAPALVLAAFLLLAVSIQLSHCDIHPAIANHRHNNNNNNTTASGSNSSSNKPKQMKTQTTVAGPRHQMAPPPPPQPPTISTSKTPQPVAASTQKPQPISRLMTLPPGENVGQRAATKSSAGSHYKENLLSSLSESIERQHFLLNNPIRSLVQPHARPSKFDQDHATLTGQLTAPAASTKSMASIEAAHSFIHPAAASSKLKSDESMRQIMSQHSASSPPHRPAASSADAKSQVQSQQPPASSWREIARAPVKMASNLVRPNKLLGQVLAYLSPADHAAGSQQQQQQSDEQKSSSFLFNSFVSPFSARANNQPGGLMSLYPKKIVFGFQPQSSSLMAATEMPLNRFIERPGGANLKSGATTSAAADSTPGDEPKQKPKKQQSAKSKQSVVSPDKLKLRFNLVAEKAAEFAGSPNLAAHKVTSKVRQVARTAPQSTDEPKLQLEPQAAAATISSAPVRAAASEKTASENQLQENRGQTKPTNQAAGNQVIGDWIKLGANHLAQNYLQDSFRDLLTLSQLPILAGGAASVSTAPSELEPGGKRWLEQKLTNEQTWNNRTNSLDDLFRYAYLLSTGVRRKRRDPLKAMGAKPSPAMKLVSAATRPSHKPAPSAPLSIFKRRKSANPATEIDKTTVPPHTSKHRKDLVEVLKSMMGSNKKANPRGVMWDMATDPSLAVTVFHLLERASVALPLGFMLMPFVHMMRHPKSGITLGRVLPARASHRSVDYEELAKRLDQMDKILSRALRSTHREAK